MIERTLSCLGPHGFHKIAYTEWPGPSGARTLVCVHGLTRNGRDFDRLAEALSTRYRVICPDMPGRGKSDWLAHPEDYAATVYLGDIGALIARLDVDEIDWVGTSMGGIIGMYIAAAPGTPIRRLVLNDIGPVVAKEGLARLATYVGNEIALPNLAALEAVLRQVAAPFGPLTDAEWHHLAVHSLRHNPDGTVGFNYDHHIGDAFKIAPDQDLDLWAQWGAITCPTLVLRGAESDLLRRADAEAMTHRGPDVELVEFPGVGHAPALMAADQIATISGFLG